MAVWESRMARSRHAAFCGSRLQVVFVQLHVPVGLGQAGGDEGKGVLRVRRGLNVIGAVFVQQVENIVRLTVYRRRGRREPYFLIIFNFNHPLLLFPV